MASWKKIIVSGSNAELNHITSSGNLEVAGNISGSSASTGSFGRVSTGKVRASQLRLSKNDTEASDTTLTMTDFGGGNMLTIANGSRSLKFDGRNNQGVAGLYFDNNNTGMLGSKASTSTVPGLKFKNDEDTGIGRADANQLSLITGGTEAFRVTSTLISGSAASTGSFGRVEATTFVGDGSGLTGLTSAAIETYNNSGDNRILTSVNSTTVQGEAGLTFDGSELRVQGDIVAENFIVSSSVTYMTQSFSSGSTIFGDTIDDTHQFTGSLIVTSSALTIDSSGSVSGSSTSTGSFGVVESAGDVIARNKAGAFISGPTNKIQLHINTGQRHFLSDAATGGVAAGAGASVTGDGVSIGYLTTAGGGSSVAIGRGLTTTANQVRIGESGVTDAYLGQGNATLHIGAINSSGNISGSSTSTGSFGRVEVPAQSGGGPITLGGGAYQDVIIGDGTGTGDIVLDGNSEATLRYKIGGAEKWFLRATSGNFIEFRRNSQNYFRIDGSGNVGINLNNDSPSERLHVKGNIFATGNISGSSTSTGSFGSLILADKIQGDVTVGGDLIVEGDTIQQQVANLNVEDRFILLNSGSASGDGGIVVQTESANGDGVAFAYDDNVSRWGFQQGTKLNASASAVAPDAYASAVVTSDDSNYQKNGNIRVEGGEIYIYVE